MKMRKMSDTCSSHPIRYKATLILIVAAVLFVLFTRSNNDDLFGGIMEGQTISPHLRESLPTMPDLNAELKALDAQLLFRLASAARKHHGAATDESVLEYLKRNGLAPDDISGAIGQGFFINPELRLPGQHLRTNLAKFFRAMLTPLAANTLRFYFAGFFNVANNAMNVLKELKPGGSPGSIHVESENPSQQLYSIITLRNGTGTVETTTFIDPVVSAYQAPLFTPTYADPSLLETAVVGDNRNEIYTQKSLDIQGTSLILGLNGNFEGQYVLESGQLYMNPVDGLNDDLYTEYIGYDGKGTFTQNGGSNVTNRLILGTNTGSQGSYTLNSGDLYARNEITGLSGEGLFTQQADTYHEVETLVLGFDQGARGTYYHNGGTLHAHQVYVGNQGTGTYTFYDGNIEIDYALRIANGQNSIGTFTQNNGSLATQVSVVGQQGTGAFTQSGGQHITDQLTLGVDTSSSGTYLLESGTLVTGTRVSFMNFSMPITGTTVGESGKGYFTQTGGTHQCVQLLVGVAQGSYGEYTLGNLGSMDLPAVTTDRFVIGVEGTGDITHSGGTLETGTFQSFIGYSKHATGTYTIEGNAELNLNETLTVGHYGTGTLNQKGGTITASKNIYVASNVDSTGTYSISSGTCTADKMYVGLNGTGTFAMSGGSCQVDIMNVGQGTGGTLSIQGPIDLLKINEKLVFEANSHFDAIPGSSINFDNASVEIWTKNPIALAGLSCINFIFSGDSNTLAVAGADRGSILDGYINNFAIDTLTISGGLLELLASDNELNANEAVYVNNLIFENSGQLDLNNFNLYYKNLEGNPNFINGTARQINAPLETGFGPTATPVPEPSVMILFCAGMFIVYPYLTKNKKQ